MDTGTDDDDEDEDGQISKYEEEEERDRKRFGKTEPDDEPITLEDLNKCRLSRVLLAKHCMAPWFDEYIKGMFSCPACGKGYLTHIHVHKRCLGTISCWDRPGGTCLSHL